MIKEFSLAGKTALLTGSSRGIGRGMAEVLLEAGADIAINALTDTWLAPLVEEMRSGNERMVIGVPGDCSTPVGARAIVQAATDALGHIDILVNGVGDSFPTPFGTAGDDEALDAEITRAIDLNLMSAIHCSRAVAPQMLAQGHGRIINLAGLMGLRGSPRYPVYSAAKAGIIGLTRALAVEWAGRGITVNAIAPGVFPDPYFPYEQPVLDLIERSRLDIPMQRIGTPRDAGLLALYLASDAGAYMTGQTLSLDGGSSAA